MTDSRHLSKGSVLLLAFHFPPENHIASARPYRFYKYLPRFGYDPRVITAAAQDEGHPLVGVVQASDNAHGSEERLTRRIARWISKPLVTRTSQDWAFASSEAAKQIISQGDTCAVISTSPPPISNFVAGRLKERFGIPWIADFRDPLSGNPDRSPSGLPWLRDIALERWAFRRADILIANTGAALEMWRGKYPQYTEKMHLIWNGFDSEDPLRPMPIPPRAYRLLVHTGGIHAARHPGILLASLHRLVHQGRLSPRAFLVRLVGRIVDGWDHDKALVGELVRLGCLEYDGQVVPREEAKRAMGTADFLILLDLLPRGQAVQVPGKLFDYIRIGRPVLAVTTPNSPAEHLLSRSGVPYTSVYPEEAAEKVDTKVLQFLALPTEPIVATEWFRTEFEAEAQARQLASLISSIGSRLRGVPGPCVSEASLAHPGTSRGTRTSSTDLAVPRHPTP